MINTVQKTYIERTYLNIIKAIYYKSTANFILNCEKLKAFLLRSETRQGCPLSPLLLSTKFPSHVPAHPHDSGPESLGGF